MNQNKSLICFFLIISIFFCLAVSTMAAPTPIPTPLPTAAPATPNPDTGLLSDINNTMGNLFNTVKDMTGNIVDALLETQYKIINDGVGTIIINSITFYLDSFMEFIKSGDPVFSDATVKTIYDIMKPVAYSLAALFFIIGLAKSAMYFEVMSFEIVLKSVIMLVIGKYLIDKGMWILQSICEINRYLSNQIIKISNTDISTLYNLKGTYDSATTTGTSGPVHAISSGVVYGAFATIALITVIAVFIVLILRQIQLGVLVCAAPLFFSTIVADVSNDVFKSYLKHFVAVAFQTTFMTIAVALFCGSIKSFLSGTAVGTSGGFIGMLVGLVALSFYMVKTPSIINGILGVSGGSGSGLNIASIAGLFTR